jgi:ferredoxin-NADP reductase
MATVVVGQRSVAISNSTWPIIASCGSESAVHRAPDRAHSKEREGLDWNRRPRIGDADSKAPASLVAAEDPVICYCMNIKRSALLNAVEAGCSTVQALSSHTQAGTVCSGCLPRLATLAGALLESMRCLEVINRAPCVKSFRFEMLSGRHVDQAQPGQRLVIQARIDGVDVQRPYTITSSVTERRFYEITVQHEPNGIMSNWLFNNVGPGSLVDALTPSGTCAFALLESRPLVCLVGGIGITPALSICRSAAATNAERQVHVDYSVSTRDRVVCAEELSQLASQHQSITYRTRITGEEGRFQTEDLSALSFKYSDCDWLICGSQSFQVEAKQKLLTLRIKPQNIYIESFRAFNNTTPDDAPTTAVLSPGKRKLVGYGLVAVIAAFLLQALLDIKWPLLDRLQTKTVYSALTGTGLLFLLVLQWRLAYTRVRHGATKSAKMYGLHIAIGPAVLGTMWLHSTHLGYGLSMAVCLSFIGSLATGAILGAHPRSPRWEGVRRCILGGHIAMSSSGSGFAVVHGITALWY